MTAFVIAQGAVSALGSGEAAFDPGSVGAPAASAVRHDDALARSGLAKPFVARVSVPDAPDLDRASLLLELAADQLLAQLEPALPDFRQLRIGLALGTSAGGMLSFVRALDQLDAGTTLAPELARAAPYFGPAERLRARLGVPPERSTQLLAACASSTFAIGQALTWLALDAAELVIAGGYDALSTFVAAGFECLGATSASPAPFRARRDGLALGEGAALLALARRCPARRGVVLGFAATSDAGHVTAPDRTGQGLARAAAEALADAGLEASEVGLVSAHGTGTRYNDAAEAKAIDAVLGPGTVVHAFKATIGHTLGAAGALESLAGLAALERGLAPATAGAGEQEPLSSARVLDAGEPSDARACLKLSSAFGGANAALVLAQRASGVERAGPRPVRVLGVGMPVEAPDLAALRGRVATDPVKLGRMDSLSLLAVEAAVRARDATPLDERAGVIVGSAAATLEIDADFERRRRRRGPEPRRFPATSPNLCAGECSIALGLQGPSFSVGGGPAAAVEALLVAHDWISAGRADQLVLVAAELVDGIVSAIWQAAGWPPPAHGAVAAVLGVGEGTGRLSRDRIVALLAEAAAGRGALSEHAPGWPVLRQALALGS